MKEEANVEKYAVEAVATDDYDPTPTLLANERPDCPSTGHQTSNVECDASRAQSDTAEGDEYGMPDCGVVSPDDTASMRGLGSPCNVLNESAPPVYVPLRQRNA